MPRILAADHVEAIKGEFQEYSAEMYNRQPTAINSLAEVMPLSELRTGTDGNRRRVTPLFKRKTVMAGDYELEERGMAEGVVFGSESEVRTHFFQTRYYAKGWRIPTPLLEALDIDGIRAWARERGEAFGAQLAAKKETEFGKLWTQAGYTAGAAIFKNKVAGFPNGLTTGKLYDGYPWANLLGNERQNIAGTGSGFYNHGTYSLGPSGLSSSRHFLRHVNAYDEVGTEVDLIGQNKLMLIVGSQQAEKGREIIGASGKAFGNDNDGNAHADLDLMVYRKFDQAAATAWALVVPKRGVRWYDDAGQSDGAGGNLSGVRLVLAYDEHTDTEILIAHARWALGVYDWRFQFFNNFPTSAS